MVAFIAFLSRGGCPGPRIRGVAITTSKVVNYRRFSTTRNEKGHLSRHESDQLPQTSYRFKLYLRNVHEDFHGLWRLSAQTKANIHGHQLTIVR